MRGGSTSRAGARRRVGYRKGKGAPLGELVEDISTLIARASGV